MLRFLSIVLSLSFLVFSVFGQTETIPDPAGSPDSVVVLVTTDPNSGEATTSIISTILPTTTTPTATTANPADVPGAQQGPVGAPPDTSTLTGPPQIVFTYTTNDGGGNLVVTTTFTPTYQTPNPTKPLSSGTVWAFSEYTAQFGTATETHGAAISLVQARPNIWKWTAACGVIALGAGGALII